MRSKYWKRIVASLLVIALPMLGLQGCGGGGGGPSGPPTQQATQQASGQVKTDEIGGTGLKVLSAYQESAPVDENGSFTTRVSQVGAQLLFLLDSNGALRGLSLSIPPRGRRALLTFDAESTALSLLFLTPGILSIEPDEAQSRIEELKGLSSFSDVVNFLKQELPQKGIPDIVKEEEYNELLSKCIEEWLQKQTSKSRDLVPSPAQVDYFEVSVKDQSNPSKVVFELKNKAFRFVNVYRRVLDSEGKEIKVDSIANGLNSMSGAKPASWGSIFTLTFAEPTTIEDTVNFLQPQIGICQYWIRGPGFALGSETLPPSITDSALDAWGLTIVCYFVLPIVNLCGSQISLTGDISQKAREIWKAITTLIDIGSQIDKLINASDVKSQTAALCDIVVTILGFLSKEVLLQTVLAYASLAFSSANYIIAAYYLTTCDCVSKIEVRAYGGADITVKQNRR